MPDSSPTLTYEEVDFDLSSLYMVDNYNSRYKDHLPWFEFLPFKEEGIKVPEHPFFDYVCDHYIGAHGLRKSNGNLLYLFTKKDKKSNLLTIMLILLIPSIIIAKNEYSALKVQGILMNDYTNNKFSLDLKQIEKIGYKLPNLASNAVPISTYLSRYYFNEKKIYESIKLLNYSLNINKYDFPILFEGLHTTITIQLEKLNGQKTYVRAHNIEHNF